MEENDEVYLDLRLDLSIPHHPVVHGTSNDSSSILKISFRDDEKQGIKNSSSNCSKEEDNTYFPKNCSRKMLKLTRYQTTLLEGTFKQHSTLNTAQRQALAAKLNLKPRQVQVWFQNRRARTKLKQTNVACELLKKNYEILCQENQRLKKELVMLRSSIPFFCHIPTATANETCLSCEKIDKNRSDKEEEVVTVMET